MLPPIVRGRLRFHSVLFLSFGFLTPCFSQGEEPLQDIRREVRDDGIEEKLHQIEKAYDNENFDLALSLSESIKDTITLQKQLEGDIGEPVIGSENFGRVAVLPKAWFDWAHGWEFFKSLSLSESVGIERIGEPIDLVIAFDIDQATDLYREIRVARVEEDGALREVPSQVYDQVRREMKRLCHVVFFADVPADSKVDYLLFYGNPFAELPDYSSDLKVEGEDYALEIASRHYVAQLSDQTGQLERLRYTRQHGLELFAGGKGHGEPPTIDWSNDYVDQDHYQKLRIRNWAEPPNYEVVRGPLCIRVRRWGFPHSPIHPLFTPSRMHIDQTYVFYAGKDYFIKEGVMEAAKDIDFSTMRDDEWVLSGYSFTQPLWLDRDGNLQEGLVPDEQREEIWGVGFYHPDSRDAFLAMWLEHTSNKFDRLLRNGVPVMHYHQHGQLWSRYPAGSGDPLLHFEEGTSLWQRNAYLVAPYPEEEPAGKVKTVRDQMLNPLQVSMVDSPTIENPQTVGALARDGETPDSAPLKPEIWKELRKIVDEQLYRIDGNAVDLGYIYDVRVHQGVAEVLMTMPHKGRPVYDYLVFQGGGRNSLGIRERLMEIEGIRDVVVDFTWYPPWNASRLSDKGRRMMGLED